MRRALNERGPCEAEAVEDLSSYRTLVSRDPTEMCQLLVVIAAARVRKADDGCGSPRRVQDRCR
jgi:hypothetical protein